MLGFACALIGRSDPSGVAGFGPALGGSAFRLACSPLARLTGSLALAPDRMPTRVRSTGGMAGRRDHQSLRPALARAAEMAPTFDAEAWLAADDARLAALWATVEG